LKTEPSPNDAEWQAHTDLVQVCLEKMVEMSESTVNPSKGAPSQYLDRPDADRLNRAMPHVRSMLTAMWDRDLTTALAHGETTSAALPRQGSSRFSAMEKSHYGNKIFIVQPVNYRSSN
jgi:hypothetical protein